LSPQYFYGSKEIMKKILSTATLLFISTAASAASLKGDYPACTSENAFEKLQAIIQHKDQGSYKEIMGTECFFPKKDLPVDKIVSMGWTSGVAQVKVYFKGELYDLWTNTENLQ